MKLETFFEKFDLLAEAPNSVAKVRELVLELAIRGRLATQDANEESAAALLARVAWAAKKRHRGAARLEGIDAPFQLPSNWAWARLNRVLTKLTDGTHHSPPNGPSGDFMYVTAKNIKKDGVLLDGITFVSAKVHAEIYVRCNPSRGDVLYVKDGATTGIATINQLDAPFSMLSSVALLKPSPAVLNRYLLWAMRSPFFYSETRGAMKGAAITRVTLSVLSESLLPLPPLAEQKRIVAKVDELMALCDRLEAQQQERETRYAALSQASLARFADAPTPANLNLLLHKSYAIEPGDLRKAILTLAIQGRLVAPARGDEEVGPLLERSDRQRRETARLDRRAEEQPLSLLSADDRWEIPHSWSWRALADLVLFVDYRGKTPAKTKSGARLLTAKNVRRGAIDLFPEEFLSEDEYRRWMTRGLPAPGDVLFTTEAPMGNAAVVELTERFALAQRVICFRGYGAIDPAFLVLQILSDPFQLLLEKNGTGVTAKGIKAGKLKRLPIAVPPLAEQRRIVNRVGRLMALVDRLEAQLNSSRGTAAALLDAVVAELSAPVCPPVAAPKVLG